MVIELGNNRMRFMEKKRPHRSSFSDNVGAFAREELTLSDGKTLEVIYAPDEAVLVPMTSDDKVILIKRRTALGNILTALSAVDIDDPLTIAMNRTNIGTFPFAAREVTPIGFFNPWKYLPTTTHCFGVPLDASSVELHEKLQGVDPKITGFTFFSEEELYASIDSGAFTDLRGILAAQFAFAAKKKSDFFSNDTFTPPASIRRLLEGSALPKSSRIVRRPTGKDWFPRETIDGQTVIGGSGHQIQSLGVRNRNGKQTIVFLVEPFFAQRKQSLTLPSGLRDDDITEELVVKRESREETGYVLDAVTRLTPPRHPFPERLTVNSTVYEANIVKKRRKQGGDESIAEQGGGVEIPVYQIKDYIAGGYITDASVLAALLDWGRKNKVAMI